MSSPDSSSWDALQWRRRLERFGGDDGPMMAAGPNGEVDGVWQVPLKGPSMTHIQANPGMKSAG